MVQNDMDVHCLVIDVSCGLDAIYACVHLWAPFRRLCERALLTDYRFTALPRHSTKFLFRYIGSAFHTMQPNNLGKSIDRTQLCMMIGSVFPVLV